jgi:hypothetical protein
MSLKLVVHSDGSDQGKGYLFRIIFANDDRRSLIVGAGETPPYGLILDRIARSAALIFNIGSLILKSVSADISV